MSYRATRANYSSSSNRYFSLILAGMLVAGFGVIVYSKKFSNEKPVISDATGLTHAVEKIIVESVAASKEQRTEPKKETGQEHFTFYKTLTKEAKRTDIIAPKEIRVTPVAQKPVPREPRLSLAMGAAKAKKIPSFPKPPQSFSSYFVQLSSFSDFEHAEDFSNLMKKKGHKSFIVASNSKSDKGIYKVRIGKYKDLDEATDQSKKLNSRENLKSFVVKD